jgi:predicted AAA+ superfamily ATPase
MNWGTVKDYKILLESLAVYRDLLKEDVVQHLYKLLDYISLTDYKVSEFIKLYNNFYSSLINNNLENGVCNGLEDYFISKVIYTDNIFTRTAEHTDIENMDKTMLNAALQDLKYLSKVSRLEAEVIKKYAIKNMCETEFECDIVNNLPSWNFKTSKALYNVDQDIRNMMRSMPDWGEGVKYIQNFHKENGAGIFAKYTGFIWEGNNKQYCLRGIEVIEAIRLKDLTGYENERQQIINNTVQFVKGFRANNVLLYGDRGTGKSSTVKALLNEYFREGLRIIEIPKAYLCDFQEILRIVKERKQKFIFFIDDLVFGDNEESYTSLKAILEGGLESRPDNVVIYATSNRRHLIVEKFSDRRGSSINDRDDDVHRGDTVQEKLSLADRFGITITFISPDKQKYLGIVQAIAERKGLNIDLETLHREALIWEKRYNGLSPRTARQFVDWIEGQIKSN